MSNYLYALCLISIFSFNLSFAQENVLKPKSKSIPNEQVQQDKEPYRILFGVEAGINLNMYSQNLDWNPDVPLSITNVFKQGSGISPYFAIILDFPIEPKLGIQAKLTYDIRNTSNTFKGFRDFVEFSTGMIDDAEVEAIHKISGADISISAMLRYRFTNELVFTVGPMISIPAGDYTQELKQTALTENVFFYDEFGNASKELIVSETIQDVKTRFGFDVGLGYDIPVADGVILTPTVRFNYMLSNFHGDQFIEDGTRASLFGVSDLSLTNSKLNALKFGLTLWF